MAEYVKRRTGEMMEEGAWGTRGWWVGGGKGWGCRFAERNLVRTTVGVMWCSITCYVSMLPDITPRMGRWWGVWKIKAFASLPGQGRPGERRGDWGLGELWWGARTRSRCCWFYLCDLQHFSRNSIERQPAGETPPHLAMIHPQSAGVFGRHGVPALHAGLFRGLPGGRSLPRLL